MVTSKNRRDGDGPLDVQLNDLTSEGSPDEWYTIQRVRTWGVKEVQRGRCRGSRSYGLREISGVAIVKGSRESWTQ